MADLNLEKFGMVWRAIHPEDEAALVALDTACKAVDGQENISNLTGDAMKAAAAGIDNTLCVAAASGLAGAAWVLIDSPSEKILRIVLGGKVHPDFRRKGIGEALLAWGESRGQTSSLPDHILRLTITNEALTEDANALYLDYGYENILTEFMLVCPLDEPLTPSNLPDGTSEMAWDSSTAALFFTAYAKGFKDRLGDREPDRGEWISSYEADNNFRPDLSRVYLEENTPVGFVTCEILDKTGWISQIAVVQEQRRKGLAQFIMGEALHRLQTAGCQEAALHVNANNARAASVFFKVGFTHRLTRARYIKEVATGV